MAWVFANDAYNVFTFYDFATFTEPLDGCSDFHGFLFRLKFEVRFSGVIRGHQGLGSNVQCESLKSALRA